MTNLMHCTKCGQPHPRCAGHVKNGLRKGQPCMRYPKAGATVCYGCGGAAPQVRAAAARRQAVEEARRHVEVALGQKAAAKVDPVAALQELINWSSAHVAWYLARVRELKPDALVFGDAKVTESQRDGLTVEQKAEINVWLKLYNAERDRLADYCSTAIRVGLAEREVRLAEQTGALIADVIRRVLSDLELTPDQQARALDVVPRHLRAVADETGETG